MLVLLQYFRVQNLRDMIIRTSNSKIRLSLLHCVRQGDHSSSFSNDFGSQIASSPVLTPITFTRKGYTPMKRIHSYVSA